MQASQRFIVLDAQDNVATVVQPLAKGEEVATAAGAIRLLQDIPYGHKFALQAIPKGGYVIKYGTQIGRAIEAIAAGQHVHVHNVEDIVDEVRKR